MPLGFQNMLAQNVASRQNNQNNFNEMISAGLYSLTDGMLGGRTQAAVNQDKSNYIQNIKNNIKTAAESGDENKLIDALKLGAIQLSDTDPEGSKAFMEMYSKFQTTAPSVTDNRTALIKEFEYAKANGFDESFTDFIKWKKDDNSTLNVGSIPAGFQLEKVDGAWRMSVIKGGPADKKEEELGDKEKARITTSEKSQDIVLNSISKAKELFNDSTWYEPVTGVGGAVMEWIPGSSRNDLLQRLKPIRSNISFDRLQRMRAESPTGGALGNVSNYEVDMLASVMGSLEMSQSKEQLLDTLNEIEFWYNKIVHGISSDGSVPSKNENIDPFGIL